ncbi:hypothetical protein Dda_2411 [Drechslerella dactyloides]|uniref:Uncharacterized protein n=1 Tax=Drechslerella dactyloides TaxID=74499 RepID=A0AAD6J5D4_DREDA|nr:hypothetical protein Dda_2411 [Drechslerella dactyloides]
MNSNSDTRSEKTVIHTESHLLSIKVSSSMTSVELSPPKVRTLKNVPSPKTRAARQAAIRYNTRQTDMDKIQRTVQDIAFQASLEVQAAVKHPSHATKRLNDAITSTVAKSTDISGSLAMAGEGGRKGLEHLVRGCGHLAKKAKRAARRASITLSGAQQQNGGLGLHMSEERPQEILEGKDEDGEEGYDTINWSSEVIEVDLYITEGKGPS